MLLQRKGGPVGRALAEGTAATRSKHLGARRDLLDGVHKLGDLGGNPCWLRDRHLPMDKSGKVGLCRARVCLRLHSLACHGDARRLAASSWMPVPPSQRQPPARWREQRWTTGKDAPQPLPARLCNKEQRKKQQEGVGKRKDQREPTRRSAPAVAAGARPLQCLPHCLQPKTANNLRMQAL